MELLFFLFTYYVNYIHITFQFASPCAKKINEIQAENSHTSINGSINDLGIGEDDDNDASLDDEELLAQKAMTNGQQTAVAEDEEEQVKLENFKQRLKDELVTRDGHE